VRAADVTAGRRAGPDGITRGERRDDLGVFPDRPRGTGRSRYRRRADSARTTLHEYRPDAGAWRSFGLVACAFFGLGIAVWDFSSPLRPRELGHLAPGTEPGGPVTGQLNDVSVDHRRLIYTVDRRTDLCYVLEIDGD
jgi:hypothetical protein